MSVGGEPTPGAAPTLTPQSNRGEQASGAATVQATVRMLEGILARFGPTSEEYRAVLDAIHALIKAFKRTEDRGQELLPAELRSRLMDSAAPPGQPPPTPGASDGSLPPGAARGMPGAGPAPGPS